MKTRLLLIIEPGKDGVFAYVERLVYWLQVRHPEIEVDLIYSSVRDSPALYELVASVKARGGETLDLRVGNGPRLSDLFAVGKILSFVARRKPKMVHAHSSKAGALARIARLVPGFPPILYSPHAYFGMGGINPKKEAFYNRIESFLGRLGATHNCSEDEREFAREQLGLNPDSLHLIHHGIDTARFAPATADEKKECRQQLGLPETGKLLVTVGRDSDQKNYAPLYPALDAFLPGSGAMFAHAGNGSLELRETLSPAARLADFLFHYLEHPEVLLRASDGFILTSRYEGLSFSMLQALSCGVPLILTEAPGLRVLKPLGFSGVRWLAAPAQSAQIITTLREWLRDPPFLPAEQRELACRYFTEEAQFAEMVKLYSELS